MSTSQPSHWRSEGGSFTWTTPDFRAVVSKRETSSDGGMVVDVAFSSETRVRLELDEIAYTSVDSDCHSARPAVSGICVQQPYLAVSNEVSSSVGLRMVAQVLGEAHGLTLDVRLETVGTLEQVELVGRLTCEGLAMDCGEALRTGANSDLWCGLQASGPFHAAILLDLGGGGVLSPSRPAAEQNITWFRQSLEKGVILVGRFGLVCDSAVGAGGLKEKYGDWLERPTFL